MFTRREDFEIMRLVGASNLSLRTPSVIEGMLYGGIAAITSVVFLYAYIAFQRMNPFTRGMVEGAGLMGSFLSNIISLSLVLFTLGISIGAISGFLAVRRYLKV